MAEQNRGYLAGVFAAAGFLFAKLLAIMYWPVTVYYRQSGYLKRALPIAACLLLLMAVAFFGFDSLYPARSEFSKYTSGNIWFLLSRFIPDFLGSTAWQVLPVVSYAVVFFVLFLCYARAKRRDPKGDFDRASAFVAVITLLFLILSKKSNTFYITMGLLPLIHVLVQDQRRLLQRLAPLAFVGSITTIELFLWHNPSFSENVLSSYRGIIYVLMESALLLSYIYWIIICFKSSIRPSRHVAHDQRRT